MGNISGDVAFTESNTPNEHRQSTVLAGSRHQNCSTVSLHFLIVRTTAVPDVLVISSIVAATLLIVLLLIMWLAYRWGYAAAAGFRSPRFDRLSTALRLNQTVWRATLSNRGFDPNEIAETVTLVLRQSGSRIVGEGEDQAGRRWSFEGIVFRDLMTFVTLERTPSGHALGTGQLRVIGPHEFSGTHSSVSQEAGCVLVRTMYLVEMLPVSAEDEETDSNESVETDDSARVLLTADG